MQQGCSPFGEARSATFIHGCPRSKTSKNPSKKGSGHSSAT
jgi:hypothetical protein